MAYHAWFTTPEGAADDDLSVFDDADSVVTVEKEILARIKQGIDEKLAVNKKIDRAELCTLPYAQVALDTGSAAPVSRRQYPIPYHLQESVEERIISWLQTGTISQAPIECEWNSPLVAAPKKDDNGGYTKLRLCLDTRALNALLVDVKYSLPLHSSRIFSTKFLVSMLLLAWILQIHSTNFQFARAIDRKLLLASMGSATCSMVLHLELRFSLLTSKERSVSCSKTSLDLWRSF